MKQKQLALKQFSITLVLLVIINLIGSSFFKRFDLTKDKRYTLSTTTQSILSKVNSPLYIDVFLEGDFPLEFKRLQTETKQLLEEFNTYNNNIIFQFVNPVENEEERVATMKLFYQRGMQPLNITVNNKGKQTQEVVFPWAVANYGEKGTKVALLKNLMGASTEEKVISSVQHLEFAFAEAIHKISIQKQKKIAILKGNGELDDAHLADFLTTIRESYFIAPFTLDSVAKNPIKTLKELQKYDLAIIANPTTTFSEKSKQVLDQYIINGGKTLWFVDNIALDFNDINTTDTPTVAFSRNLNLTDMFFSYGFRINPLLIKDEQGIPIKLASGEQGSKTHYQNFIWRYSPYIYATDNHPIVKNMEGIKFEFASPIEILKNDIQKTILLTSSLYSKTVGLPQPISLDLVTEKTQPEDYNNKGSIPVAVLLEGNFTSMYKNRVLPFKDNSFKEKSTTNKMIVVSDGNVIKNELNNGTPLELGFDKWTNNLYGNKEFVVNCVNYLLNNNGLISIRNKEVHLPLLNKEKVYNNYTFIQLITLAVPLLFVVLFGLLFTFLRKKRYQ